MKKIALIILAVFVLALTFSACEKDVTDTAGSNNPSIKWVTTYEKPVDHDIVMEALNEKLIEKIGATVELNIIDSAAYQEKINLMIASEEEFDLCFTSNWRNPYKTNVEKGAYLKLDELLETEAPKLKNSLPDYVWEGSKVLGGIYAVPNYQVMFRQVTITLSEEIAEKYNFDIESVKELKDIEPMLEVIKANEPDLIPFIPSWTPLGYIYSHMGNQLYTKIDDNNSTIYTPYEAKEYLEYLDLIHRWYKKGYIPADAAIASGSDLAKITAINLSTYKPGVEMTDLANYGHKRIHIPLSKPYITSDSPTATMNAISASSKNPEKAIKLLEVLNIDKEIFNLLCFGIEGEHYKKAGDNRIEKINDKYKFTTAWMFGNQFNAYLTPEQTDDVWEKTIQMNDEAVRAKYMGFIFDTDNFKNEVAAIAAVQGEYEKFLNSGVENPHNHLEEYKRKLQHAGIEKMREEAKRQLEEWKKSQ